MTVQLSALRVGAEFDASKYVAGATQKEAADKKMVASGREVAAAVSQSDARLSQSGDVLSRLSRQYVDGYANAQKFNGAITSLTRGVERGKIEMQQASVILDGIYRKYGMMADATRIAERGQVELARAVERANARFQEQKNIVPSNQNVGGVGGRNFAATNAMFQFQDIAMTAAMGMNPAMIGLQQGSQLAGAYAGMSMKEAAATSMAAVAGMVNPVSMAAIGLTVAAAAAIQFGTGLLSSSKEAENFDKVLKRHQQTVKDLAEQWGGVIEKQSQYGQRSSAVVGFGAEMSASQMRVALRKQIPDVLSSITSAAGANLDEIGGAMAFRADPLFKTLTEDVDRLVNAAKDGSPDIVGLTRRISELARASNNPGIRKLADEIVVAITPVEEFARQLLEAERAATQLFNTVGPNGMALSQGRIAQNDNTAAALYESQNRVAAERSRQAFDAQVFGLSARSPQERAEAARRSEAARYDMGETAAQRRMRIEQAAALALAQAENQLRLAQEQRAAALNEAVSGQQNEINLLGKTGGELVALRKEYELTSQLRLEAARQGIEVDQRELDLIKDKTKELGRLTDLYNQRRFEIDMGRQIADSRLSERDRGIVTTLRQYGLAEDLNGANAQMLGKQYDWQQAKDLAKGFGSAFSSELISGSHNIGKAFLKGFESAVTNAATKMWEKLFDNLGNAFADWVTGGSKGGGLGGLGGGASSIASSVMSSTSVAANDNSPVSGAGASLAWNFWKSKGLADYQVAGILGNIKAESGFNPLAVGDSGNAFGLYQHNDRRNSLFSAIGGRGNLGDELAQHKFAYSELMGPENRSWQALMASKDVRGATAAFAGFERPSGFSWANPEGAHNFSGRLAGAEQALSKFGGTATQATQSLGGFGNGLSQVGNALSGAGGGAGGIFGLTSLGMGIFNKSGQFASAMLGGGLGLFADGTESAPGGLAMVGERGRELVRLPRGSQVIPNHRTESMVAANRNARGGRGSDGPQTLQVVIQGASGDAHIRMLVEQGVNSALADQNVAMRRGAFGTVNKAYSDDKG